MKSQPPLRLATFCVEASHALQGVVVDSLMYYYSTPQNVLTARVSGWLLRDVGLGVVVQMDESFCILLAQ